MSIVTKTSPKNLTLYISADLAEKMDTLKEVNWSQVARDAIQRYVDERLNSEISVDILNRLRREIGDELANGKKLALEELVPKVTYRNLENFFTRAESIAIANSNAFAEEEGIDPSEAPYSLESAAVPLLKDYFTEIPKEASNKFCKGVFLVLEELWNKIQK